MARPSKYTKTMAVEAEKLCKLGSTDVELAKYFGVAVSTINKWKLEFSEFSEAIKKGRTKADAEVAHKLFDRATGAKITIQQAFKVKTTLYDNGRKISETERIEIVDLIKEEPPDTAAAIFWLSNRERDKWSRNPVPVDGEQDGTNAQSVEVHVVVKDARKHEEN